MLTVALVLFVVLPLTGALVIGAILFFERTADGAQPPARPEAATPGPGLALRAGRAIARLSQPGLQRVPPAAWEMRTSGSHRRLMGQG
jgi:hypothetical protein